MKNKISDPDDGVEALGAIVSVQRKRSSYGTHGTNAQWDVSDSRT